MPPTKKDYCLLSTLALFLLLNLFSSVLYVFYFFAFACISIFLSRESDQSATAITSSLRRCQSSVYHTKTGESRKVSFRTTQQVNLPACFPHCPYNAERQARKMSIAILKSLVWSDSESNPSLEFPRQMFYPLGLPLILCFEMNKQSRSFISMFTALLRPLPPTPITTTIADETGKFHLWRIV